MCLGLYLAALCGLVWALFRRNWRFTFAAVSLMTLAVSGIMKNDVFSPVAWERTMKPFVMRVNRQIAVDQPLVFYRDADYGVMFYAHRHIPTYGAQASKLKPPFFILMREDDLAELGPRPDLKTLDISEGLGPAGRHRLALVRYRPETLTSEPLPVSCPGHGSPLNHGKECNSTAEDED
jgi:hypothetical protein